MSRGKVIAVEGVCCAGKTTLVKGLSGRLSAGVIPELPEFGRNLFRPFKDSGDVIYNSNVSIPIEKVRMVGAVGLSQVANHVVMDRCFLSTLALGYGAIDVIGTAEYLSIAKTVLSQVNNGDMPIPDKVLYLGIDGATVEQRNRTRAPQLDEYWTNCDRVDRQNQFYSHLSASSGVTVVNAARPQGAVLIDCIDHARSPECTSQETMVNTIQDFITAIR